MIRATSPQGYIDCARALLDGLDPARLSALSCPTLFIAGAQDVAAPPQDMQAMYAAVPRSHYRELNPASHLSNIENPRSFDGAINAFLSRFSASNSTRKTAGRI